MKYSLTALALLSVSFLNSGPAAAQTKKGADTIVSVTGCLAQGDEANEYSIKDGSGKTFGLKSSSVDLKKHLGHQVMVTGTAMKEHEGKKEARANEESEHLRVDDLKMVSTTCQ